MPRHNTILTAAALALAACAQSPASIPPVSMAGAYDGLDCSRTLTMREEIGRSLAALEAQQRAAVVGDAVGVFLIAVPVSSLTGSDRAGEIGAAKGKRDALDARLLACG